MAKRRCGTVQSLIPSKAARQAKSDEISGSIGIGRTIAGGSNGAAPREVLGDADVLFLH